MNDSGGFGNLTVSGAPGLALDIPFVRDEDDEWVSAQAIQRLTMRFGDAFASALRETGPLSGTAV